MRPKLSAEARAQRRKIQNRVSQQKRREREKKCKTQARSRGTQPVPTGRRTTHDESNLVVPGHQCQDKLPLADESDYLVPMQSHESFVAQLYSNEWLSHPRSPMMPEYTSPFEEGYALMHGGPAWECMKSAGTQKDGGTQSMQAISNVNRGA
ncbi:hypothetical protein COCC4DRAFT_62965 [Bipolaris maydis ATCC 48331]|uniref:BZIP domain-containing protein n=2 Tax=Cochliobolus heterostrophus TaxID=5016 RepID=M2TY93_COCH5|nr:uncharacterized protein COCC4DRAFT_62965 [Bipolaris maydis ATCC 48331]EMD86766.1 hypothetical protein COCHEDRAFT_1115427 [Bipolaris maydis C5]KAJ5052518.1 hypothetical protein J3E74DRAFT_295608 [Bipolaris maydis]ENI03159.1 hypothetical protein COCC4DRAFT_62965 [Bipolaris maydis ATCC 48331]KAJ6203661.1 hypothetical protein PSV09DRAFT_1115427 [Bipolaris maydis]KAJ6267325.1 hypothetical protein PSV08DRAFT_250502 [Bipolaris maydis]